MSDTKTYPIVYLGDSLKIPFTVLEDGAAKSLVGLTTTMITYTWVQNGAAAITKTISSGITVTNAAGGLCTALVAAVDTSALTAGVYSSYLTITDTAGLVNTCYAQPIYLYAKN